jgi:hypothetical protein
LSFRTGLEDRKILAIAGILQVKPIHGKTHGCTKSLVPLTGIEPVF